MVGEFGITRSMKALWILFIGVLIFGLIYSYKHSNQSVLVFFIVGLCFWAYLNILIWSYKISLDADKIILQEQFGKKKIYNWEDVKKELFKDISAKSFKRTKKASKNIKSKKLQKRF